MIKGMGELHLEIKVDILRRTYKVEVTVGEPQVAYREKMTSKTGQLHPQEADRRLGPIRRVMIDLDPPARLRLAFENQSRRRFGAEGISFPASRRASKASWGRDFAGFPVVDVKATLIDGAYHDVDSSALAVEIAARAAFREGLQKGGSVLLEPIMKVEVVTPEEHTGFVMGDLTLASRSRPGSGMRANAVVITRWCRWPTCSATSTSSARARRAAPTSRCSSITTNRSRRASRRDHREVQVTARPRADD